MAFDSFSIFSSTFYTPQGEYSNLKPIGLGSFGLVVSAINSKQMHVAIKKISNPFTNIILAKRLYREFVLLETFRHDNILNLLDAYIDDHASCYLVTDLFKTDMEKLLASQSLETPYIQCFLYQICRGLKYIHSAGWFHRDLKPSNLLINENCDLKICDFGLARVISNDLMTDYVSTRYYRAPEIMLSGTYDKAIDIWSVGCIFAEMLEGLPLFPGENHIDQFVKIVNLLGFPTPTILQNISDETMKFLDALPRPENVVSVESRFSYLDKTALDLLQKILLWDPKSRISAQDILCHPYLCDLHDENDEPNANFTFDESFIDKDLGLQEWKTLLKSVFQLLNVEN